MQGLNLLGSWLARLCSFAPLFGIHPHLLQPPGPVPVPGDSQQRGRKRHWLQAELGWVCSPRVLIVIPPFWFSDSWNHWMITAEKLRQEQQVQP